MKRILEHYLAQWKRDPSRKSLLIRGARQVGKTFTVRKFGETFVNTLEVNFEKQPALGTIFERDLDPVRIVRDLSLATDQPINPGRTLLFLDEVQQVPKALTSLRYFNEDMPELHVVAAGSLIDFAIEEVGIPVGRVSSLYMYPLSLIEFLAAKGRTLAVQGLISHDPAQPIADVVHQSLLNDVGEYLAVGGMPEAVAEWIARGDLKRCTSVHRRLADTYRQDFARYSKEHQIKYLDLLFDEVPRLLGQKFVFSRLRGKWRRRDLQPALELLSKAAVVHRVCRTAATGLPLGAEADPEAFKVLFVDIGLAESILGFDGSQWILDPEASFVNQGGLVESFVGQELLAYGPADSAQKLHYWHREARSSNAEVDYVISAEESVIPIEVKSGATGQLKSMWSFLAAREAVAVRGVRFSAQNFSTMPGLHSLPLYAVGSLAAALDESISEALLSVS